MNQNMYAQSGNSQADMYQMQADNNQGMSNEAQGRQQGQMTLEQMYSQQDMRQDMPQSEMTPEQMNMYMQNMPQSEMTPEQMNMYMQNMQNRNQANPLSMYGNQNMQRENMKNPPNDMNVDMYSNMPENGSQYEDQGIPMTTQRTQQDQNPQIMNNQMMYVNNNNMYANANQSPEMPIPEQRQMNRQNKYSNRQNMYQMKQNGQQANGNQQRNLYQMRNNMNNNQQSMYGQNSMAQMNEQDSAMLLYQMASMEDTGNNDNNSPLPSYGIMSKRDNQQKGKKYYKPAPKSSNVQPKVYYKDANGNPLPVSDQLAAGTDLVINVEEYVGPKAEEVVNPDRQLVETGGTIDDYDLAPEPEVLGNTAGAGPPPRPNNIREVIQKAPNGPLTIKGLKNEAPKVIKKVCVNKCR